MIDQSYNEASRVDCSTDVRRGTLMVVVVVMLCI